MTDPTEDIRRAMLASNQPVEDYLDEPLDAPTWDTQSLQEDFEVLGFMAPFVVVRRRSDGVKGTLEFVASPRVYFGWHPED